MAHIARMKCPFLNRLPTGFAKRAGNALFSYAEKCPVMNQLLSRHASTNQQDSENKLGKNKTQPSLFWGWHVFVVKLNKLWCACTKKMLDFFSFSNVLINLQVLCSQWLQFFTVKVWMLKGLNLEEVRLGICSFKYILTFWETCFLVSYLLFPSFLSQLYH